MILIYKISYNTSKARIAIGKKEKDMYEEIGDVDRVKMYKMIGALLRYDYFSAKCLVELLIEKRKDKEEIEKLKEIKELLYEEKNEEVLEIIENCTKSKLPSKRRWFLFDNRK